MCESQFWAVWRNPYLLQEIFQKNRGTDSLAAAKYGNLEAFKYSVLTNCSMLTMNYAATYGHLNLVKWLWENREEGCAWKAFIGSINNCHFEVFKWLYDNVDIEIPEDYKTEFVDTAAKGGHLDLVKWLVSRGEEWSTWAMDYAGMNGHLETCKWLYSQGATCTHWATDSAAQYGHVETLQWLLSMDSPVSDWALEKSAYNGNFEIVKMLMDYGMKPTMWSFYDAIIKGHLDVVKYMYYNSDISENIEKADILAELRTQNASAKEMIEFVENEM